MGNLKTLKKIFAFLLCLTLLTGTYIPALADDGNVRAVAGEGAKPAAGASSSNCNLQEYRYQLWSAPVTSYLVKDGDGVMRVEATPEGVAAEYYDARFGLVSSKNIEFELPLFGGFYEGTDNYFLVFGQGNPDEDNNREVIRVVRYTKSWERVGAASLCGANTTVPFDAGSLRMVQYGDYLYVLTCHEMYETEDGLNHQANLIFSVNIPQMKISDGFYDIWNIENGYVSHSFNQFIAVDEGRLLAVNHGDASPRCISLTQYPGPAGQEKFTGTCKSISLLWIKGEDGDNNTGVGVGGFEVSDTSYLVAGNSIDQEDQSIPFNGQRNIFLSVTPRGQVGDYAPKLLWVTNYADDAGVYVSVPHLTKITDNYFALTWAEGDRFCCQFTDGDGNLLSETCRSDEGIPSDCRPIAVKRAEDGGIRRFICWYATNNSPPVFFLIPVPPVRVTAAKLDQTRMSLNVGDFGSLKATVLPDDADDNRVTWTSSDPETVSVSDGALSALRLGTATVTATTKDGGYTAGCTVTVSGIRINEAVFPDPAFRKYIGNTFDKDNDQVLSEKEHSAIKDINVGGKGISSIKGIEHFSGLTSLDCQGNGLTGIDVCRNTALTKLDCGDNSLSDLDVSLNTALIELRCDNNRLRDLDVCRNTALTKLDCSNNELTSLDISANIRLDFDGGGFKADGNVREAVDGMKVTKFPGLDLNKVKSCKGGEFFGDGKFKFDEGAKEATYVYDAGQGMSVTFTFRKSPYKFGDLNGDGKANIIDARWLLQIASGSRALAPGKEDAADVNGDGKVNIIDARWMLQVASGSRAL